MRYFITASVILFIAGTFFFVCRKRAPEKEHESASPAAWNDQFFQMKRNEAGTIPRIASHNANHFTATGNLLNVQGIGPYNRGGRTRALMIDRVNANHIIAGGVTGGVWASYDKGQTWAPINDHASSLSNTCIVQDPFNPLVIYYGSGEVNTTTQRKGIPGDGVFKSTDGGQTFSPLSSTSSLPFDFIRSIKMSLTDSSTLFVGTADSGLYVSSNGGVSFTNVFSNGANDIEDIETFSDGKIMIGVKSSGIYVSLTGQPGTFTKLTGGLPASGFVDLELAYCDSFPDNIYALLSNSTEDGLLGAYKSIDGGNSWSQIASPETVTTYSFPWYALMLGVKPDDPNFIISGDVYMVHSTNGGASWTASKFSRADNHVIAFDPTDASSFYVGNDGGVYNYNTSTVASAVTDLNTGYIVTQFYAGSYFPTGVDFWGGTQDNSTLSCFNADSIFTRIDPANGDGSFTANSQQNPNTGYISWQYGRIRRADNALNAAPTFTSVMNQLDANASGGVDDGVWFDNPFEMNLLDGNQIYFITYKRVWRTVDGAANWVPLTNQISSTSADAAYAVGISNAVNPTVYIGGSQMLFYRVDNAQTATAGSEVNLKSSAPPALAGSFIANITVHPLYDSIIYVSLSNYSSAPRLYLITNAKSNAPVWTSISGDIPNNLPVNWMVVDPSNPDLFFIAATDYGLYSTVDGGNHWTYESSVPNVQIQQLRIRPSDRKLFIFTHGRGVWSADLPAINTTIAEEPLNAQAWSIYPNPAKNKFTVYSSQLAVTSIEIYNALGQKVFTQSEIKNQKSEIIDVSAFNTGIYFVQVKYGEKTWTQKLLIQ